MAAWALEAFWEENFTAKLSDCVFSSRTQTEMNNAMMACLAIDVIVCVFVLALIIINSKQLKRYLHAARIQRVTVPFPVLGKCPVIRCLGRINLKRTASLRGSYFRVRYYTLYSSASTWLPMAMSTGLLRPTPCSTQASSLSARIL